MNQPAGTPLKVRISPRSRCEYLTNRTEQLLYVRLATECSGEQFQHMIEHGWRRIRNVAYRPICDGCSACLSLRIHVRSAKWRRSHLRILRRNQDLVRCVVHHSASEEHCRLYARYMNTRHGDSLTEPIDRGHYLDMTEENPPFTRMIEYRDPDGRLVAAAMSDLLPSGMSMTFSYFEPGESRRSLGRFMILDHIGLVRETGGEHLYLGYWVPGCKKLRYKSGFMASEVYHAGHWTGLPESAACEPEAPATAIEVSDQDNTV